MADDGEARPPLPPLLRILLFIRHASRGLGWLLGPVEDREPLCDVIQERSRRIVHHSVIAHRELPRREPR